ncbi:glycosyl hydrolase family 32 [Microbacterium sp. Leaf288]|nr:glycoside hydrolase family 32 protein [Microbacterium sp. B35-30]KAF2415431.1 glycosyl hydrolase family 32 [Microbacterium sp. B35-30]KQP67989.1 glycosyl hydrolase family 32 [Microbacterium sp. Leaf288]
MRPALHFTATSGWINDPHGVTYRDGQYHAFYQYVPGQTVWGPNCHWGHAAGPDLLSLRELPVAIVPGDGDDGIWTGCVVTDDEDNTRAFYTSTTTPDFGIGRIRVATPVDDDWLAWSKDEFVVEAPADLDLIAYRDPFVRREETGWRMFVGGALRDGTAVALSYISDDLQHWTYSGIALQRSTAETEPVWMGALWECPQILSIDGRAIMVSSIWDNDVLHYAGYAVGSYNDGRFVADNWGRLTFGDSYYAPSLFSDSEGRPCLLFWMRGIADEQAEWASAHSIPYLLSLDDDRLVASVHPDVEKHRGGRAESVRVEGTAADVVWSDGEGGELTIASTEAVVSILWKPGEATVVERTAHALNTTCSVPVSGAVRVVIDGPILELSSAGGLLGLPTDLGGTSLQIAADRGDVELFALS